MFQRVSSDPPRKLNPIPYNMLILLTPELVRVIRSLMGMVGPGAIAAATHTTSGAMESVWRLALTLGEAEAACKAC